MNISPDRIRKSTSADIAAIHAWLLQSEADSVHGSFLCNWNVIEKSHRDGRLTVFVDGSSKAPVAYHLGDLIHTGILEVRHDMRGKGIGRKLVTHCIKQALKNDECLLKIECSPRSSIPFWQAMEFRLFGSTERNRAIRVLPKKHLLPADSQPIDAAVRFYPEERKYSGGDKILPYETASPNCALMPNGIICLSERVSWFDHLHQNDGDLVMEIVINGKRRYCDKAKYPEAKSIGVKNCSNGFYIDQICPT